MTSSNDGYVHDPDAFDAAGERVDATDRVGDTDSDEDDLMGSDPATVDREFGRRGWFLVGMIVLTFFGAPLALYLLERGLIPYGMDYRFALMILPIFPGVALAITAVWATTRP